MGKINFINNTLNISSRINIKNTGVKRNVKKAVIMSFVSFMAFMPSVLFTACDKKEDKEAGKEENPKYVYEASFKELGNIKMDSLGNPCFNNERIYVTGTDIDYGKDYQVNSSKNYLLQCSAGSDKVNKTKISGLKDNECAGSLLTDGENRLYMVTYIQDYNKKTGQSKTQYYMMEVDESGQTSGRVKIQPDKKDSGDFYLGDNIIFSDGKLVIYFDKKICIFNKDGSAGRTFELGNYIDSMFTANNGRTYILSAMEGADGLGISEIDLKTGKPGKPASLGNNIYNIYNAKEAANGNVYLNNGDCLYEFDFKKGKAELVFNWVNVDIDGNSISGFIQTEDGDFSVLNMVADYSGGGADEISADVEIATVSKKKYSDIKQKKILTLASNYIDMGVKREILKFNKTDNDYRIEVEDYSTYEDPSGQMNLDIAAGKIPDIIDAGYMPKELYIKKGFLADLYPLIEKDDIIKKEDFIDTVLTTLEHNGKLYYLPVSFRINAFAGPKKIFGDMEGWSYEDMEKIYNDMPDGSLFMYNMTSEWFVDNMISTHMEDFVNYDTGEVNLDSEEFINIIEFSKKFKDNEIDESADDSYMMSSAGSDGITVSGNDESYGLIKKGKLLLKSMEMYDFSDIQINEKLFKSQGGYNILSYPSADKNNKLAISSAGTCFAISEKCGDKEGAWKFLRRLYTYEFQKSEFMLDGFPVRQDAMDKKIEYAMATKEYTDDDGTKVVPVNNYSYDYGDFKITLKPYTKEQMDIFRGMLGRIGKEIDFGQGDEISKIINEETKSVYSGDKTAKEAAGVIQSRVSLYVNENS